MLWSFAHASISKCYSEIDRIRTFNNRSSAKLWSEYIYISTFFRNMNILAVRPEFTGTLAIKSGRHPIMETFYHAGTLVSNDVYCDDSSSFQIIQGPKYIHLFYALKLSQFY